MKDNDDDDSLEIRPTLKLSKCTRTRKPSRKRVRATTTSSVATRTTYVDDDDINKPPVSKKQRVANTTTTKRQRKSNKKRRRNDNDDNNTDDDIPIPSFTPVHNMDEMDTSILDSPPLPQVKKQQQDSNSNNNNNLVILLENDDDDDDALLLDGPPTFASSKQTTMESDQTETIKDNGVSQNRSSSPPADDDVDDVKEKKETTCSRKNIPTNDNSSSSSSIQKRVEQTTTTTTTTTTTSTSTWTYCQPNEQDLIVTVDSLFVQQQAVANTNANAAQNQTTTTANNADITMGEFVAAVSAQYCCGGGGTSTTSKAKLHKTSRHFVKKRLRNLLSGNIEPTVSLHSSTLPPEVVVAENRVGRSKEGSATSLRDKEEASSSSLPTDDEDATAMDTNVDEDAVHAMNDVDNDDDGIVLTDDDPLPPQQQVLVQSATNASHGHLAMEGSGRDAVEIVDALPLHNRDDKIPTSPAQNTIKPKTKTKVAANSTMLSSVASENVSDENTIKPKTKNNRVAAKKTMSDAKSTSDAVTLAPNQYANQSNDDNGEMLLAEKAQQPKPKRATAAIPKKKSTATRRARTKKGTCALCTTCSCTIGKDKSVNDTPVTNVMPRTDAEMERALIKRAKKLEAMVDKYQSSLDHIQRELKKQRRIAWKKQEAQLNDGKRLAFGDSRFLPDADVWNEQADAVHVQTIPTVVVQEAQGAVFGTCQPTLTQIFGSKDKSNEETANEEASCSLDPEDDKKTTSLILEIKDNEEDESLVEEAESIAERSDLDEEEDPIDHIHRVSWRKGKRGGVQNTLLGGSGAWFALTSKTTEQSCIHSDKLDSPCASPTRERHCVRLLPDNSNGGKYNCAWDTLFADEGADDDNTRMDQLLHLFENEILDEDGAASPTVSQRSDFDAVLLSQRGESIADEIEKEIVVDPMRQLSIEAACPRWRDNIRYALAQRGPSETRQALEGVRRSLKALQATKDNVTTIWDRQEVVLKLFEATLSASLSRFEPNEPSESPSPTICGKVEPGEVKKSALSPILEDDEALTG